MGKEESLLNWTTDPRGAAVFRRKVSTPRVTAEMRRRFAAHGFREGRQRFIVDRRIFWRTCFVPREGDYRRVSLEEWGGVRDLLRFVPIVGRRVYVDD